MGNLIILLLIVAEYFLLNQHFKEKYADFAPSADQSGRDNEPIKSVVPHIIRVVYNDKEDLDKIMEYKDTLSDLYFTYNFADLKNKADKKANTELSEKKVFVMAKYADVKFDELFNVNV